MKAAPRGLALLAVAAALAALLGPLLVDPVVAVPVNVTVDRLVFARPNIIAFDSEGGLLLSRYLVRSASFDATSETSFNIGVVYYCYQAGFFGICAGLINVTLYDDAGAYITSQSQLFARAGVGLGRVDFTFTGVNVSDVYAVVVYTS